MKIVGLTGGIGSGKTTIAKMFAQLGAPVYIADIEARKLTNSSKVIRRKIIDLFGDKAYKDKILDRSFIANIVFHDSDLLEKLNKIIHPKVAKHFKKWVLRQEFPYCIKEAAILFENDGYKNLDTTILVTAPIKVRMERVLTRDTTTEDQVKERMDSQWSDAKKMKLADIVIKNTSLKKTQEQVKKIHELLIK